MRRQGGRRGGRPRAAPAAARDPAARAGAKALLARSGAAFERGDEAEGRTLLEAAVAADPTFVEPALALSAHAAAQGDGRVADHMVEEAVRRARAQLERIPERPGGIVWWHDEATRPYLKALVARGFRRLARGDAVGAAEQFAEVWRSEPEDPLQAGVYAAEAWLRAGEAMTALRQWSELEEQPAVAYGRALALLATGQEREAIVSLWIGVLLNPRVAEGLVGPVPFHGIDRAILSGDDGEAEDLLARSADLWGAEARELLADLVGDAGMRADLARWGELVAALDRAEDDTAAERAIAGIEPFLASERVEHEADAFRERRGQKPKRPRLL